MKKQNAIDIAIKIIMFIAFIIIVIWSVQILLGGSPTLSQVNSMFIVMIITILFAFMKNLSALNREIGEIKTGMKHSFSKIKDDMDLIKKKLRV